VPCAASSRRAGVDRTQPGDAGDHLGDPFLRLPPVARDENVLVELLVEVAEYGGADGV
jgi:hypothetical protein